MELRAFAEQVLFATTLDEKLSSPGLVTDERPGLALLAPAAPGRPADLAFKPQGGGTADFPGLHRLEDARERGRLLHFFANHELLATELMALVLLRFPEAPAGFRRGVYQTLKDEQEHTRLYLQRMRECGIEFGELPVSGYFWRCVSGMESPMDYVSGLCLTFEQANLDFCQHFARGFEQVGDVTTARLLEGIYRDEIGHVASGLKWFRRWKQEGASDWEAFCRQLKFPLSPQRAKGPILNRAGRLAAGLAADFIDELNVYSHSKGRTPGVFWFNPYAEGRIALGNGFTPKRHQALLAADLANVPQFLCRQDDIVLVPRRPSVEFLSGIKEAGFPLPEFVELPGKAIPPGSSLAQRKIGALRPWAWGPDSLEVLAPLFGNASGMERAPAQCFNETIAGLYSKAWSAAFLARVLASHGEASWLCPSDVAGVAVNSVADALTAVATIRARGHHRIVAKQAFGLAGHNAIRLWEPEVLDTHQRWLEQSTRNGRQVVIEPWLERELDFSLQLEMEPRALKLRGYTGLINDRKGQYQANTAAADFARRLPVEVAALFRAPPDITSRIQALYANIISLLQAELQAAGYLGPVGIDAFVYRDAAGAPRLKPVVEINPRYTMGRLTVELMQRVAPGSSGRLRLVNLPQAQAAGAKDLAAYAAAQQARWPVVLAGEPRPKIREGVVCLNEPARAQVCLAIFQAGPRHCFAD